MNSSEDLIRKVRETIKKYNMIEKGEGIVIGVSGGPDSICLLHVLKALSDELGLKLHAVHVNHMLRGTESDMDELYVSQFCSALGVDLQVFRHDIVKISAERGISTEEAGREARYADFRLVSDKTGAVKIAVAHNMNDQAETLIMHMLRGSGTDGLRAMEHVRGDIIRPLLDISRRDIEEYCAFNELNPRIDSSNSIGMYTRNRVRNELLPLMCDIFGTDSVKMLWKLAEKVSSDVKYLEGRTEEAYRQCMIESQGNGIWLDTHILSRLDPALRSRVLRMALGSLQKTTKGIESVHIESIEDLICKGKTGAKLHLPGGLRVYKSYGRIGFDLSCNEHVIAGFERIILIPGCTQVPEKNIVLKASLENGGEAIEHCKALRYNSLVQFFDYDKISRGIYIRSRKNGDVFKPIGSNGTKKLKEYFIDRKIPRELRDSIPLVAKDNEIIWIVGYKISDKFKVTENTKNVLRLEISDLSGRNER